MQLSIEGLDERPNGKVKAAIWSTSLICGATGVAIQRGEAYSGQRY